MLRIHILVVAAHGSRLEAGAASLRAVTTQREPSQLQLLRVCVCAANGSDVDGCRLQSPGCPGTWLPCLVEGLVQATVGALQLCVQQRLELGEIDSAGL